MGGISIEHSGAPGDLVAFGQVQEATKGFSNVIDFADPQKAKSTRLDGAGLRFGSVAGQPLAQVAVVRNVSNTPVTVKGRIPYTSVDGNESVTTLPNFQLAPGEVKRINLNLQSPADVATAGLEFSYSGEPGSVIAAALSYSADHNQVFRLPMRDATVQASSTGHYPWSIDASSATVVYIKNTTDSPKPFTFYVGFEGGDYALGVKTIPAGQTVAYDVRQLRDSQQPDSNGLVIPLQAQRGQIHWSVRGSEIRALIGRAEQANLTAGISTTSACGLCCPDSFQYAWLTPGSVTGAIGGTTQFVGYRQDVDCNGYPWVYQAANPWGWSCDNTSVATVNSSGFATAVGVGSTYIRNTYSAEVYTPVVEYCTVDYVNANAAASCTVQPTVQISGPTTVPLDSSGQSGVTKSIQLTATVNPSGGTFSWSTNSNKVSLSNTTSATVTVTSASASTARNDITITVTYTVNGQNKDASRQITVVQPTSLVVTSNTFNSSGHTCDSAATTNTCTTSGFPGNGSYTSYLRTITYDIYDQFSPAQQITGANMYISESFTNPTGPCAGPPATGAGIGQSISDCFYFCAETCRTGGSCNVSATQTLKVNGFNVATKQVNWTCGGVTVQ